MANDRGNCLVHTEQNEALTHPGPSNASLLQLSPAGVWPFDREQSGKPADEPVPGLTSRKSFLPWRRVGEGMERGQGLTPDQRKYCERTRSIPSLKSIFVLFILIVIV